MPILDPAPAWESELSEFIFLFHGCTLFDKNDIERAGINLTRSRPDRDFGRGFYTTTLERQARHWAWDRYYEWRRSTANMNRPGNLPVVLRFRLRRYTRHQRRTLRDEGLDKFLSLHFVRGDYDCVEYWSFVQHCRASSTEIVYDHRRGASAWYDLVSGPVTAFWQERALMAGSDQFSFHTKKGTKLLNALVASGKRGNREDYQWASVHRSA